MQKPKKSQDECREDAVRTIRDFVDVISEIDDSTPWSEREPTWWVEMMSIQETARQYVTKHETT